MLECKAQYGNRTIGINVSAEELPTSMPLQEYAELREEASKEYFSSQSAVRERHDEYEARVGGHVAIVRVFSVSPSTVSLGQRKGYRFKFKECFILDGRSGYIITCQAPPELFERVDEEYFKEIIDRFKLGRRSRRDAES